MDTIYLPLVLYSRTCLGGQTYFKLNIFLLFLFESICKRNIFEEEKLIIVKNCWIKLYVNLYLCIGLNLYCIYVFILHFAKLCKIGKIRYLLVQYRIQTSSPKYNIAKFVADCKNFKTVDRLKVFSLNLRISLGETEQK